MERDSSASSPRIAALDGELGRGNTAALTAFWADIAREGTPIIEEVAGDTSQRLVTFVWRDDQAQAEPTRNVILVGHVFGWDFAQNQLQRLRESDLWYFTAALPAETRTTYTLARNDSLLPVAEDADFAARFGSFRPDPLARRQQVFAANTEDDPNDQEFTASVLQLPDAPPQPWVTPRADVAAGEVVKHRITSAALGNERSVWVYTPPGYDAARAQPYGLLVVFDGFAYLRIVPTPTILDNLLAEGRIPPLVALLVDSPDRTVDLACSTPFTDFLVEELLPWARAHYTVSDDPAQVVVAGSSLGGLAAAYAGLRHPEAFGNVLAQSGAFWWRPTPEDEHSWLTRQYAAAERLPLRFYLDAGLFERGVNDPSILICARELRDVLRAKGYPVVHAEFAGGHDYLCWQGTLADGLLALTTVPGGEG